MKYRYREPHELKESGIEWIGKIPKEWEVKKLKYVSELNARKLSENEDPDFEINYVDIGNVNSNGKIEEIQVFRFENAPSRARRIIKNGDTIVSTVRTYLKAIAYFEKAEENLICSTGFAVFSPHHDKFVKKYFYYLISSDKYINEIVRNSVGVSYPAINASQIADFNCFLPKIEQQSLISSFLDRKCAEFDGIVEKKQSIILKLEEAKKSLISEVVTGKVKIENNKLIPRKEEELKDSGIEWIGKIPKEWVVKKLKYVSEIINGSTPKTNNSEFWDGNIKWATPVDVSNAKKFELIYTEKMITKLGYESCGTTLVPPGSIILTTRAPIGNIAITKDSMCTNQGCKSITNFKQINEKNLFYLITCATEFLKALGTGTTFKELSSENLKKVKIPISPEEQSIIASFLDKKTAEIDSVITKIRDQIEKIKKAKQSLISEAVTGKIEVMEEK